MADTFTTSVDGQEVNIPENEAFRAIAIDRIRAFAEDEKDADERELLNDIADWLQEVKFVQE